MTSLSPKIGVIGLGRWAALYHVPSLVQYEGCQLTAVADTNAERVKSVSSSVRDVATFDDPAELLDADLADGVVISVPHPYHYPLVKAALTAGVHVFVEKPLTLKAAEAWELVELAEDRGLHLMVGYTHQVSRTAQRLHEIIQSGGIGELLQVSMFSAVGFAANVREGLGQTARNAERQGPPMAAWYGDLSMGGGLGYLQTTHSAGMMFYLTGRRAVEVCAYMHRHDLPADVADAITFRLDNGAVGTVSSIGALPRGMSGRKEAYYVGTEGVARHDPVRGVVELHYGDGGQERLEPRPDEKVTAEDPVRRFADLLAGRADNPAPGPPAACAVELMEAAYRSADDGGAVTIENHGRYPRPAP